MVLVLVKTHVLTKSLFLRAMSNQKGNKKSSPKLLAVNQRYNKSSHEVSDDLCKHLHAASTLLSIVT